MGTLLPPFNRDELQGEIGRFVRMQLKGSTTITGNLVAVDRVRGQDHLRVKLTNDDHIQAELNQARYIELLLEEPAEKETTPWRKLLVPVLDRIVDQDPELWAWSLAVHEAAHGVVGLTAGVPVKQVEWTYAPGEDEHGGHTHVEADDVNSQALAVMFEAGCLAQARCLGAAGYDDPAVGAALEATVGEGDMAQLDDMHRGGFVVWRPRAWHDAQAILAASAIWESVERVARELRKHRSLSKEQLESLVGDPAQLTGHRVWIP
ncbi:hypothetical protein [Nocardiopsis synnemataformans]|uniref:hypothetical protein n=1 Tax=Nocardiopsis synnemataformans TaxID=61305 RepID=UPI003EBA9C34